MGVATTEYSYVLDVRLLYRGASANVDFTSSYGRQAAGKVSQSILGED
jgi:hypothetical protein